jgi:osmotically-inducible protein OsmY
MAHDPRRRGEHAWNEEERGRREGQKYGQERYGHGYGSEFDEPGSEWGRSASERDWGRREEFGRGREYGRGYDRDQEYGQGGRYGRDYGRQFEERGYGGTYGRQAGMYGQGGGLYGQPEAGRGFEQTYGPGREQSRSWMHEGQRQGSWQGQGAYAGRGPKGYTRSDDRIKEDVCDRLTDDPGVDASNIEVSVSNCEVNLAGTVDSREAKRRAEDCAENVSGVRNVQNNIRVQQGGMSGGFAAGEERHAGSAGSAASKEGKR